MTHKKGSDVFHTLPGGGQNHNEDLHAALKRECREEAGADVSVGNLVFVRDYIANNHEFAATDADFHQVEFMFQCTIVNPDNLHPQTEPDTYQIGMEWIRVDELLSRRLFPLHLREKIIGLHAGEVFPVYLGDVN